MLDGGAGARLEAVVGRAMRHWRPPKRLKLSEWADEHFYLSAESAAQAGRWTTIPYQRGVMDAITDPRVERVSLMKSARVGAALALDTPLPTPTGWTTMGAVAVGDRLLDDAGRPCRVVAKSPVFLDHQCFRVRFCDGAEIVADAGHRWRVEADVGLAHLAAGRRGRTGRPKPGEIAAVVGVIDTETMARSMLTSRGRTALAIANAAPLDLPTVDLPFPSYTLGLWLGDGHTVTPRITQHRSDVETAAYIAEEGIRASVRYIDVRYPNNATIFLDVPVAGRPVSPWASTLRSMGLLGNKHIPAVYLRASVEKRLALLRGLMDSDGTCGLSGRAEFTSTIEALALGVYELVVSLGMKATVGRRGPSECRARGKSYTRLPSWRVNFKPTPDVNPFRLLRKADRVVVAAKPSITKRRRVVAVDRIASVPVQCVEVDSPSRLYLAGRQMVPTHNTKMMDATVGYYMHQDPCPIMVVQPTIEDAEGFSKEEIAPMLRDCPVLAEIVPEARAKNSNNTLLHKKFPGGVLSMVGANSGRGFRRVSRKVLLCDEIDGYPASAGTEGDPISLAIRRTEFYWDRKIYVASTPGIEGRSRISEMFEAGDQRRYFVPCPQCGHFDHLVFKQGPDGAGHFLVFDKDKPEVAHFCCSKNGCVIEHQHKRQMIERGEWRASGTFAGHASFHIWAAYSYSPNATWGLLATEFLEADKGGPEKLKTFVNTALGQTWQDRGDAPEYQRLYNRREKYPIGTVPEGVLFLTAGVDVQRDRLVVEVVGWGENKQSWSIDAVVLPGDTSAEVVWGRLDELLAGTWPGKDGVLFGVLMLAIDSGFNTNTVYNWARRHPMSRVIACKGSATANVLIGSPSPVDVTVRGKRLARGYKVWSTGVSVAKSEFYGWLRQEPPPPPETGAATPEWPHGYCHFPEYGEEYFRQITAEQLVRQVKRSGHVSFEWQLMAGRENHFLDCRILARAASQLVGLDRLARPRKVAPPRAPAASSPPLAAASAPPEDRPPPPKAPRPGKWLGEGRAGRGSWLGKRR